MSILCSAKSIYSFVLFRGHWPAFATCVTASYEKLARIEVNITTGGITGLLWVCTCMCVCVCCVCVLCVCVCCVCVCVCMCVCVYINVYINVY